MADKSNILHFKLNRIKEYLSFWIRLPYHVLFHKFDPYTDGYQGWNVKGFIICGCGYVEDLGMSYGQHCKRCYDYVDKKWSKRERQLERNESH